MNKKNLSSVIFSALSVVAHEVFKRCVTECEAGRYSASEVVNGMKKNITFEWGKAANIAWKEICGGVTQPLEHAVGTPHFTHVGVLRRTWETIPPLQKERRKRQVPTSANGGLAGAVLQAKRKHDANRKQV